MPSGLLVTEPPVGERGACSRPQLAEWASVTERPSRQFQSYFRFDTVQAGTRSARGENRGGCASAAFTVSARLACLLVDKHVIREFLKNI